MKKTLYFLLVFILCSVTMSFEAMAQQYQDGNVKLIKIPLSFPKETLARIVPTPPEVGGSILINRYDKDHTVLRFLKSDGSLKFLADDYSKEFIEIGHRLNPIVFTSKKEIVVSTFDASDRLHIFQTTIFWSISYTGEIKRIIGQKDIFELSAQSKRAQVFTDAFLSRPTPSSEPGEDGIYYFSSIFFEPPQKSFWQGVIRYNSIEKKGIGMFSIPSKNLPDSHYWDVFWTDGKSAIYSSAKGLERYSTSGGEMIFQNPIMNGTTLVEGGVYLQTYDGILAPRKVGGSTKMLFCDLLGPCTEYSSQSALNNEEIMVTSLYQIAVRPISTQCNAVLTGNQEELYTPTVWLTCGGNAEPFLHKGVFPDGVVSRFIVGNGLNKESVLVFRARPGQERLYELEWEVWRAEISPVENIDPPQPIRRIRRR